MKNKTNAWVIVLLVLIGSAMVFWFGYSTSINMMRHEQSLGFRLPTGDSEAGKVAFTELGCVNCHSVANSTEFPMPERPAEWHVVLGGEVQLLKTYGELVTAVIHPSESIRPEIQQVLVNPDGQSIMPDLTTQMTTRQLIDICTYLQEQYELVIPNYPSNYYPDGVHIGP